ncbi:hypothetical protein CHU98_g1352 [Xylaria longipes]|nr:hypothetical protein CHU98_g1352 [Xylaria longipes]
MGDVVSSGQHISDTAFASLPGKRGIDARMTSQAVVPKVPRAWTGQRWARAIICVRGPQLLTCAPGFDQVQ